MMEADLKLLSRVVWKIVKGCVTGVLKGSSMKVSLVEENLNEGYLNRI